MYNIFKNKIYKLIFTIILLTISIVSLHYSLKKPIYKIKQVTQAVLTYDVYLDNNNLKFRFSVENNSDFPIFFSFLNLHYTIFYGDNKQVSGRFVNYRLNMDIGLKEKKDYIVNIELKKDYGIESSQVAKVNYWGEMAIQFPMKLYKYKRTKSFDGVKKFK